MVDKPQGVAVNYYQCDGCGLVVGQKGEVNWSGMMHGACGGRLHPTKAPRYGKETDPVVVGSRYLVGLIVAFLVIVSLAVWAAFGCPLPSLPQSSAPQDQTPTSESYQP